MQNTKKSFIVSLLALVVIFGLFYFLKSDEGTSFKVLSPASKDILAVGSTYTIKWTAEKLPSDNKVSITIRRIPPPPLQEEGQEFDPLIAFNLPNTGNYEWQVSDMYPEGNYVIDVNGYSSIPVTDPITAESEQFKITKNQIVGGDKDSHGCIGSAGYSWCEAKNTCIRPWEEYCTATAPKKVVFNCSDSKTIGAIFYVGDDKFVDLKLSDGRNMSIPRAISASGARYAKADESFVFWNKGDTAFITEGAAGETTFKDCVLKGN